MLDKFQTSVQKMQNFLLTMLLAMTLTLCASLKRGYAVRTPHLLLPSRLMVITLSTLLGVTVVVAVSAFSSDLHSISTTPNFGLHHPSSALISNYAVDQFLLRYVCSLSIDRHRPVGIRNLRHLSYRISRSC